MTQVNLADYDNSWYHPGRSTLWRSAWHFAGQPLLGCPLITSSGFRVGLLRFFGARIGRGVVIRHDIKVKYPWYLAVGHHCWFGESVWIDNLTTVTLGNNVCLSQGAYLCTGNHDWSDPSFGLIIAPIRLEDGAWVGAKAILTPGVTLGVNAIAAAGSVVTRAIPAGEIHAGNPAVFVKRRVIAPATRHAAEEVLQ